MYPVYTMHVINQNIDGGATEADGGASAPVGPSVATPLLQTSVGKLKPTPVSKLANQYCLQDGSQYLKT